MKPISDHYKGLPCMIDNVVGRIVGADSDALWAVIDGKNVPSIVIFCTPHGNIITTGRFHVTEISEEGMERLKEYEDEIKNKGDQLYDNRFTDEEITFL